MKNKSNKPVVMIGMVTPGHFYYPQPYIVNLLTMVSYNYAEEVIHGINFTFNGGPKTATNRNRVVEKAMGNCHYLLMIDTDMTFEKETLETMIQTAEAHPGAIITGIATLGFPPFRPAIFTCDFEPDEKPQHIERWPDEPFQIDACGSFGILIPHPALEKLGLGCFTHIYDYYEADDPEDRELRHDLAFSKRAKDAGIPIICNPAVEFGHLRLYPAGVSDWKQNRDFKPPKPLDV